MYYPGIDYMTYFGWLKNSSPLRYSTQLHLSPHKLHGFGGSQDWAVLQSEYDKIWEKKIVEIVGKEYQKKRNWARDFKKAQKQAKWSRKITGP